MTQNYDIGDTSTEERTEFGMAHPTAAVDVRYPNGETETVEPDYEIFVACNPNEFYDDLEGTRTSRIEVTCDKGTPDRSSVMNAIEAGVEEWAIAGHGGDVLVEKVYTRSVGDKPVVCVLMRAPSENRTNLSRLALAVDEMLRDRAVSF